MGVRHVKCEGGWLAQVFLSWTVTSPDSRHPHHWFYWWSKETGPNTEDLRTKQQAGIMLPDEGFPLLATCQEQSKNVVAIGYAAARWADWLKVTQIQLFSSHCSACHIVCSAALEKQAYNRLSTLVYEHFTYILM